LNAATRRNSVVGRRLDEAHLLEPGGLAGLGLEGAVQLARVLTHGHRRLAHGTEAGHQPGRVPRRARGQPVALEEQHVGPSELTEVVGDRGADDAAADDHDAGAGRKGVHDL
jgi:hypothetical protein